MSPLYLHCSRAPPDLHSFPTRRSSDLQVLRESLSNVRKHSRARNLWVVLDLSSAPWAMTVRDDGRGFDVRRVAEDPRKVGRSEEHTSELQSRGHLVCRLLLEKKKEQKE